MENKELFNKIKDLFCDGFEEVILDLDSRMAKKNKVLEDKLDEMNCNVKELISVLNKLV